MAIRRDWDKLGQMDDPIQGVTRRAGRFRAALAGRLAVRSLLLGTLATLSLLMVAGGIRVLSGAPQRAADLLWAVPLGMAVAAVHFLLHRPDTARAAALLDRLTAANDRFTVGLRLAARPRHSPAEAAALAEIARAVARIPMPPPPAGDWRRLTALLGIPLVALLMLHSAPRQDPTHPPTPADQTPNRALAQAVDQLRERIAPDAPDSAAPTAHADLEASLDRLERVATEDSPMDALREITSLQQRIEEAARAANVGLSPGDLEKLAMAFESAGLDAVADALRAGDLRPAARMLDQVIRALRERGQPTKDLEHLAGRMPTPASLSASEEAAAEEAVARETQTGSGADELTPAELDRLATLLREQAERLAAQSRQNPSAESTPASTGRTGRTMSLRELLDTLERMKAAARDGDQPGEALALTPSPDDQSGRSRPGQVPPFPGDGSHGDDPGASGPASARHSDDPVAEPGTVDRLAGAAGSGPTAQRQLPATSVPPQMARVPARSEWSLSNQDIEAYMDSTAIPIGKRWIVRRYFESLTAPPLPATDAE